MQKHVAQWVLLQVCQQRSLTRVPQWHRSRRGDCIHTASSPFVFFWIIFYYLLSITELDPPPVAMRCSCKTNATFRAAFSLFAN